MCQTSRSDMSQSWICKMIVASLKKWGPDTFANADKAFNLSLPHLDVYGFVKIRYDLCMASRCVKLRCETILYSDVGLKAWHSWLSDFCWCTNCSKDSCNTLWLRMLQDSAEYSVPQSCQLHFSCRIDKGWRIWNPNVHQARSGTFRNNLRRDEQSKTQVCCHHSNYMESYQTYLNAIRSKR